MAEVAGADRAAEVDAGPVAAVEDLAAEAAVDAGPEVRAVAEVAAGARLAAEVAVRAGRTSAASAITCARRKYAASAWTAWITSITRSPIFWRRSFRSAARFCRGV